MRKQRQAGWYWVQMEDVNGWIPWEWIGESEVLKARWFNCEEPVEIGPRIPAPDEPWQCVPLEPDLAMQKAYFASIDEHMARVQADPRFGRFDNQRLAYCAMLAATPKP